MKLEFSKHALEQMERRNITNEKVFSIYNYPDNVSEQDGNIRIYSKVVNEGAKVYLYRVFMNDLKEPKLVVTVYKTSKIEKYGYQI